MSIQLQLDEFLVTSLHIDWRLPTKSQVDVDHLNSKIDYEVGAHEKDATRYKMDLRIEIAEVGKQQREVGYLIKADLIGLFRFPAESDVETREKLVRVNGVSMLYSTFRGVLTGITGAFPGGRLTLPSIMPTQVVVNVEKRRQAAQKLASSAPQAAKK